MAWGAYLCAWLSMILLGTLVTGEPSTFETNYLFQMEEGSLRHLWHRDLNYIATFLSTSLPSTFDPRETALTQCKFHDFKMNAKALSPHDATIELDPARFRISIRQSSGIEIVANTTWEYNVLLLPISGSAKFGAKIAEVTYGLNLTQPYEGNLFLPSLKWHWTLTSCEVASPVGNLLGIETGVCETMLDLLNKRILGTQEKPILEGLSLLYQRYYWLQPEQITFAGFGNQLVQIIRRYGRIYMDSHLLRVGYIESAGPTVEDESPDTSVAFERGPETQTVGESRGVLRRYYRDLSVFEQIASTVLGFFGKLRLRDADLPPKQIIRLDAQSMDMMLPDFELKYGHNAAITLVVTTAPNVGLPQVNGAGPQALYLSNLPLHLDFYVTQGSTEVCYFNATIKYALLLKPLVVWDHGSLVLNFEIMDASAGVVKYESRIFSTIIREGVVHYMRDSMLQFLSGKCPTNIMGDGLKIRDDLGDMPDNALLIDIIGRTLSIWIYRSE